MKSFGAVSPLVLFKYNSFGLPNGSLRTEMAGTERVVMRNPSFLARGSACLRAGMILLTLGAPEFGRAPVGFECSHGLGHLSQAVGTTKSGSFCMRTATFWTKGAAFWAGQWTKVKNFTCAGCQQFHSCARVRVMADRRI